MCEYNLGTKAVRREYPEIFKVKIYSDTDNFQTKIYIYCGTKKWRREGRERAVGRCGGECARNHVALLGSWAFFFTKCVLCEGVWSCLDSSPLLTPSFFWSFFKEKKKENEVWGKPTLVFVPSNKAEQMRDDDDTQKRRETPPPPTTTTTKTKKKKKPQNATLRSHPVAVRSQSSKPLPPTPTKRTTPTTDFYGFPLVKKKDDDDDDLERAKNGGSRRLVNEKRAKECSLEWEKNMLIKRAREISETARRGQREDDDDADVEYAKRWKKALKNKGKGGQLLAKTVKKFGAPREKRGEIWYELSGARWLEENSTESYERLVERAEEEDGREAPSSGRGHSIAKNKENTNNTKSDESDDDTAYNARDGSKRSQVDRKRAKEEWAMQIDLDVDRTFSENDIFWTHGKGALRRILRAYSRRNPKTGYCQGMNYIAAFIWLVVNSSDSFRNSRSGSDSKSRNENKAEDDKDDEAIEKTAFWIFTAALDGHALCREIHARDLHGTFREFGVLHSILTWRKKRLSRHLDSIGVDFACCEPRWLVCVYLESFPSETVARIFDSLFATGFKVWHRVAISQIVKCEKEIMMSQSLPEVAGCIRAQLECSHDAEEVMERAFALRNFRGQKIAQLREKVVKRLDKEREERFSMNRKR